MEGLLPTSVKVDSPPSKSRQQPSRAQIADFCHQTNPESLTNWSLEEYQGIALRLIQFLAIMFTALALVPSGAHLAALPNKMAMAQAAYFVAQQIYAGWAALSCPALW